jgi:hypothetical protein
MSANTSYALVVYTSAEPYGAMVKQWLSQSRFPILALDYETPCPLSLAFENGVWSLLHAGERLALPDAAFYRFKLFEPPQIANEDDALERIRCSEWVAFLSGLGQILGRRFLNSAARRHAKILQLKLAAEVGFRVPDSHFFLGRIHGEAFAQSAPAVMKPIGNANTARFDPEAPTKGDVLSTTAVSDDLLATAEDEQFLDAPLWFQRRICTGYEMRIIVVGAKVFAGREPVAIEDRKLVDGRFHFFRHDPAEIGGVLRKKLTDYMAASGLDYGVFDIMESEGEHWFLECNPDGQWNSAFPHDLDEVVAAVGDLIIDRAAETVADRSGEGRALAKG